MGFWSQLCLLLWKNFTFRKRQKFRLLAELTFPLALFLILVLVRQTKPDLRVHYAECHFDGKAMPSAGTLPFIQSFLCTFNNTCYESVTADEQPGIEGNFNRSLLTRLLRDVEIVLTNHTDVELISHLIEDWNTIADLYQMFLNGSSTGTVKVGNILVDPHKLRQDIQNQNISLSQDVIDQLLNASLNFNEFMGQNATALMDFLNEVIQGGGNTTINDTIVKLREQVCQENFLTKFLTFPNQTLADQIHSQLCNLTRDEALELYYDFRSEFNYTLLMKEIANYIEHNTGKTPNLTPEVTQMMMRIGSDIRQLESLQWLVKDLNDTMAEMRRLQGQNSANTSSMLSNIGLLFCNRPDSFLQFNPSDSSWSGSLGGNTNNEKGGGTGNGNFSIDSNNCSEIFKSFESSGFASLLWKQLKPFIQGEILYTPDIPVVRDIIEKSQRTFNDIKRVVNLTQDFVDYFPTLYTYLESSANIDLLRQLASSPLCKTLEEMTNMTSRMNGSACDFLNQFLSNDATTYGWKDALNNTEQFAKMVAKYGKCYNVTFRGYDSENALISDSLTFINDNTFWAALVFDVSTDSQSLPTNLTYKIRMNSTRVDGTERAQDKSYSPGPRRRAPIDTKYLTYGFAFLQDMVDHAVIQLQTGMEQVPGIVLQQFPYPCYISDKFVTAISRSLPLFMILAWVLTTAMIVKSIVYEKEKRLKEVMKMMGLGNGVHWMAWFINSFVVMFATVCILVLILKVGQVVEKSDPTVLLVFMLSFTIATINLCFLISVFFSKANLAACCAGFIYFVLYLPYVLLIRWEQVMTTPQKALASFSSNVAFGYGCSYMALYEQMNVGLQWSNIAESPMVDDTYTMAHCIAMLLVDAVIYGLFTWYIEAVFPGQYGIPRRWYFPIQKSYWCGSTVSTRRQDREAMDYATYDLSEEDNNRIEGEPQNRQLGVSIRNLRKVYSEGKKVAVDGLTLNFYEGQITSFLGHNGAGKTTTMSILTGLFPPTEGTAYIYGKDIRTYMDEIRQSLGMCPQHNVLFDLLTVEEHIWFYARLKGSSEAEVKPEREKMIKDVGLPHKRKELSKNLSGGMKRKLSVAIAFVGGSKTVILDEPTAGVDPYARRGIWELLLKFRHDRTIILSTHHMDEADILGDRIAIISHGKLCCCGSSLFLKNRYGSGYYLTMVRADEQVSEDMSEKVTMDGSLTDLSERPSSAASVVTMVDVEPTVNDNDDEGYAENGSNPERSDSDPPSNPPTPPPEVATMVPGFSEMRLTAFIQKFVREANLVENNMTELCYQLPESAARNGSFERLFSALEQWHTSLGVSSYGISDTSLEEVFLKVADMTGVDEDLQELSPSVEKDLTEGGKYPKPVTRGSFRKKKASFFRQNSKVDTTDLLDEMEDAQSVASMAVSEGGEGFRHIQQQKVEGWILILRQFWALFVKRFHRVRRSKKGFVCEIIMPAIFVLLAMIFAQISPPVSDEPPLELHPWVLAPKKGDSHLNMFYSNDAPGTTMADGFETTLLSQHGVGNRCAAPDFRIDDYPCVPVEDKSWTQSKPLTGNNNIDSPKCSCDTGFQVCPDGAGGTPARRLLPSTDYLYNMTGRNISDWLVKTNKEYILRRYGGLSFGDVNTAVPTNTSGILDTIIRLSKAANNGTSIVFGNETFWDDLDGFLQDASVRNVAKVWFNNKGWLASVAYMNIMNNIILRSNSPAGSDPAKYGIRTINHPMNLTKDQLADEIMYASAVDVLIAVCVIFAMAFIPASFVMVLIEDRASNSKHLQFVSGVNPVMYWVGNYIWDLVNYLIPMLLCIIIFLCFNKQSYVSTVNGPCLVALLFLYGVSMIPLMYPFSHVFSVPSTALVALMSVNIFLGTTATLATFILEFFEADDPDLKNTNDILRQVFLLLPQYCLGRGLLDMSKNQLIVDTCKGFGIVGIGGCRQVSPFEWDAVGRNLLSMFMLGILFFTITVLIEYRFFIPHRNLAPKGSSLENEDIDVSRERKRVLSAAGNEDVLRVHNLTKVYRSRTRLGKCTAVDRLCFGVPKGQCFGLLGVNGAGKTTTFKMLTGDVSVTRGDAKLNGKSILSDMVKVRQDIGYCPQFDALDNLLTGREHLIFYARLRGIPEREVNKVANWAIQRLGLIQYADKLVGGYSGGNKRKLATAIALIGNPAVLFLDEPTTGMDPRARRFLWDCINNIVKDGRSVILTSHSMEECEALCGRLAIMVNGHFRCIGSIQHLKNRFGNGYTIILRISGEDPNVTAVEQFMSETFPNAVAEEKHHNMLQYQLGADISLATLFGQIEGARKTLAIEDYSVSQTTLDQVFINFAKQQTEMLDDELDDLVSFDSRFSTLGDYDEQSLTGSTVGLIGLGLGAMGEGQNRGAAGHASVV